MQAVVNRHPNLAARFCEDFGEPVQVIPANPVIAWQDVELDPAGGIFDQQVERLCAAERAAVCDLAGKPTFRAVLIRTAAERYRFVLTIHHIVADGWSLPILLQEVFGSYYGERLPAARSYRSFVTWLDGQDRSAARGAWREVMAGFETPTLVVVGAPGQIGRHDVASFRVSAETTAALTELARSCHTTVSTVLQGAWAQLLMLLTGQHDVAFGTAVSGRSTELIGSESIVGLMINTVPVRAKTTSATTVADLLAQLQHVHNDTLEYEYLALPNPPRHRSRSAVRHALRVRELSDRRRRPVGCP